MEDTFGSSSSSEQESSNYLHCCWKIAANRICKMFFGLLGVEDDEFAKDDLEEVVEASF